MIRERERENMNYECFISTHSHRSNMLLLLLTLCIRAYCFFFSSFDHRQLNMFYTRNHFSYFCYCCWYACYFQRSSFARIVFSRARLVINGHQALCLLLQLDANSVLLLFIVANFDIS